MTPDIETPSEVAKYPRELHIDDVPDEHRQFVRKKIEETIDENFVPLDPGITVEEVYVYGSFAEGRARHSFSDLDVRVIIEGNIHPDNTEWISNTIKTAVTRQLPEGRKFGYVDPQVYPSWSDAANGEVVL